MKNKGTFTSHVSRGVMCFLFVGSLTAFGDKANHTNHVGKAMPSTPDALIPVLENMTRNECTAAIQKIDDQQLLADVVMNSRDYWVMDCATERLTNQSLLVKISLEHPRGSSRERASYRLQDEAAIEIVALISTCQGVLEHLLWKINDTDRLRKIAKKAESPGMRLAATQKLGEKSWADIFKDATTNNATQNDFMAALDAANIYGNSKVSEREIKDLLLVVQDACRVLIRRGDEAYTDILKELIGAAQDDQFVEDYLRCGKEEMKEAAEGWMIWKHHTPKVSSGSPRLIWGSDK